MELNISEFDDFDVSEMNELSSSINEFYNSNNYEQFANPMDKDNRAPNVNPYNNRNEDGLNTVIRVNQKSNAVNNMFKQSQTQTCAKNNNGSYPTSCEVKKQMIKEYKQQQHQQHQQPIKQKLKSNTYQSSKPYQPVRAMPELKDFQQPTTPYDDILSRLNVQIVNGQMQFIQPQKPMNFVQPKNPANQAQYSDKVRDQRNPPVIGAGTASTGEGSYIYNKYFTKTIEHQPQQPTRPMTKEEYTAYMIEREMSRRRIRQIKSKKLIMPTENIQISRQRTYNPKTQGLNPSLEEQRQQQYRKQQVYQQNHNNQPNNLNKLFALK
jgi:hypothetical protein